VPTDPRSHYGQGQSATARPPWPWARVAVHDSRQNDRNPVIWQAGQDYRMA
jgi:hypothetical protein